MSLATKRSRKMNTMMVPHMKASVAHSEIRQAALRTGGLPVLEDIAHSSQSPDQRRLAVAVHLAAKPIDVDIHHVGIGLNAHAPHLVKDHGASDNPAGVAAQVFKKDELLRSELQWLARSACLAT